MLYSTSDVKGMYMMCRYQGVVKFVGQVEYTSGIYIGVMITDQSGVGKNNGMRLIMWNTL